ncbi:MAG: amidohydrolase [Clostridiales Family XIII bacterium]|jgi:predicted amidohydrolase YtcJ|nr:amidohydrolase [Clostridiales Family XIII bacterium]
MFQADLVFKNGVVHTMDPALPKARAVAVFGGIVAAVGRNEDMETLIGPRTKVCDLGGKTMIPGFNDSHNHIVNMGLAQMGVPVSPDRCACVDDVLRALRERAAKAKRGEWILGRGWDESRLTEGRFPSVDELDAASLGHPVFLIRTCGHVAVANGAAMKLAGIGDDTPNPAGGKIVRDERGRATGVFQENAQNLMKAVVPPHDRDDFVRALETAARQQNAFGITSSQDAGVSMPVKDEIEGWTAARAEGKMNLRIAASLYASGWDRLIDAGIVAHYGDSMHRFGCVKMLLDGGVSGGTAAVSRSFLPPFNGKGILRMDREELNAKVLRYHRLGLQCSLHAIGDLAMEQALDAYEKALTEAPAPRHRHRIEHCSLASAEQLSRAKSLGVCVNMNPGFLYHMGESHFPAIGEERVRLEFPMKTALEMGIVVGNGTDCPVISADPKYALYAAVFRKTRKGNACGESERINMIQALWTYTSAGAYLSFEEDVKGSISPGKYADFAILSMNPVEIAESDAEALLDMSVAATILGGRFVFGGID